jgi:hypothetical protein
MAAVPGRSTRSLGIIVGRQRAIKFVGIYLFLVAIAAYLATLGVIAGIYPVALTLPWSAIGLAISDAIDPKLLDNPPVGIGIGAMGVIVNSVILFLAVDDPRNTVTAPSPSRWTDDA